MPMANVHQIAVKWSKVKIDTDKDMNAKSLKNLKGIQVRWIKDLDLDYVDLKIYPNEIQHLLSGSFWFRYGHQKRFYPVIDKDASIGQAMNRMNEGWFAGNLGLGVIKNVGETLTVDIIYDDSYSEVASYLDEQVYNLNNGDSVVDWDIGSLTTFTENGVITGIKVQFDAYHSQIGTIHYKFLENGVEVYSQAITAHLNYSTYSFELNTLKTNATYRGVVVNNSGETLNAYIRNRYMYFRKRYLGIKAGQ